VKGGICKSKWAFLDCERQNLKSKWAPKLILDFERRNLKSRTSLKPISTLNFSRELVWRLTLTSNSTFCSHEPV